MGAPSVHYLALNDIARHCGLDQSLVQQWVESKQIRHQMGSDGLELASDDVISFMNQNDIAIPAELMMVGESTEPKSPRVLVVDTDRHATELLKGVLTELEMRVVTAENGYDAGITYLQKKPVLIVLGIESGDTESLDLISNISSTSKGSCKILVLSGGMPTLINKIRAAGADTVLPKPFDKDSLKRTVKILLGR